MNDEHSDLQLFCYIFVYYVKMYFVGFLSSLVRIFLQLERCNCRYKQMALRASVLIQFTSCSFLLRLLVAIVFFLLISLAFSLLSLCRRSFVPSVMYFIFIYLFFFTLSEIVNLLFAITQFSLSLDSFLSISLALLLLASFICDIIIIIIIIIIINAERTAESIGAIERRVVFFSLLY